MRNRRISKFLEVLNIIGSYIMIILLLILLWYSFVYFNINYPADLAIHARMFFVAMGITIATVIGQWIEGRLKSIKLSTYNLNHQGGVNAIGKERRESSKASGSKSTANRRKKNSFN